MIVKEGRNSALGPCFIEDTGAYYYVTIGTTKYGPYSELSGAMQKFREFCLD